MNRKNINIGFKKLRVCQDAVSFYVLACNIFANFPFERKKVAANSIDAEWERLAAAILNAAAASRFHSPDTGFTIISIVSKKL